MGVVAKLDASKQPQKGFEDGEKRVTGPCSRSSASFTSCGIRSYRYRESHTQPRPFRLHVPFTIRQVGIAEPRLSIQQLIEIKDNCMCMMQTYLAEAKAP